MHNSELAWIPSQPVKHRMVTDIAYPTAQRTHTTGGPMGKRVASTTITPPYLSSSQEDVLHLWPLVTLRKSKNGTVKVSAQDRCMGVGVGDWDGLE